jgi:hypothetical protein
MSDQPEISSDSRKLLFISYAYEDEVFARWLARKLAFYGYGVWFDQIKLLGGESWVKDVNVAIEDPSFRVLAILSKSSIDKENPRKERTLALQLAKCRGIDDFLITLNLDGSRPDWTLSDISWVPFYESWAVGLRKLLKKLDSIEAPRLHEGNPEIARAELDRGEDLVRQSSEEIVLNWLPFSRLPDTLNVYDASGLDRKALLPWPCFMLGEGKVAAFTKPPAKLSSNVQETKEVYHWPSVQEIRGSSIHTIIVQILNQTVGVWLKQAGCEYKWQSKAAYLPDPYHEQSFIRYVDADGENRRINASGKITIKKPAGAPEKVIHHPGIRYRARKTDSGGYILEIKPSLALFDATGKALEGKIIGSRQKKITRSWYNPDWRKRFMVFAQILREASTEDEMTTFHLDAPCRLECETSLIDPKRKAEEIETEDEAAEEVIEIGLDEMEDWR